MHEYVESQRDGKLSAGVSSKDNKHRHETSRISGKLFLGFQLTSHHSSHHCLDKPRELIFLKPSSQSDSSETATFESAILLRRYARSLSDFWTMFQSSYSRPPINPRLHFGLLSC